MPIFGFFSSRKEKNSILLEIIKKLNISEEEKELYILSLSVLEDREFDVFYQKISKQIQENTTSILPFSTQLI